MGYKMNQPLTARFSREEFSLFDDFTYYTDADLWTKLAADVTPSATVAHEGPGRSRVVITTGALDNHEAGLFTTNELFKFLANKSIVGEGLIQYTEAATDDANVAFGFADAMGANLITDNGAGITATDGVLIYKTDGSTVWKFHTEINGAELDSTSTTTAGGAAAQQLRIDVLPRSATEFECRPFVDGVQLKDANGKPIMHVVTLGTATDMDFGVYAKSGGASGEVVNVDYLYAAQLR